MARALIERWDIEGQLTPLPGGSTSHAWCVNTGDTIVVAKLARNTLAHFKVGLRMSEIVETAGITTGVPIRTTDDALAIALDDRSLAVLEYVPGEPARLEDQTPAELGRLLGTVHLSVADVDLPGAWTLEDVVSYTHSGVLESHPAWVGEFVFDALDRVTAWQPDRCQLLRGDGPGLLIHEGVITGMIDWGATRYGSVADDIGCWTLHAAAMHGDYQRVRTEFIAGYRTVAPLTAKEERAVPMFQRLRLATRPADVTGEANLAGIKIWIDRWETAHD